MRCTQLRLRRTCAVLVPTLTEGKPPSGATGLVCMSRAQGTPAHWEAYRSAAGPHRYPDSGAASALTSAPSLYTRIGAARQFVRRGEREPTRTRDDRTEDHSRASSARGRVCAPV